MQFANSNFLKRNLVEIKSKGIKEIFKKVITLLNIFLSLPFYPLSIFILFFVYLIRPIIIIRCQNLLSNRLGHFANTTELYCCERDANLNTPKGKFIDLFYLDKVCNKQLAKMWKRELKILPKFILAPIFRVNRFISKFFPGSKVHEIGFNTANDRDVNNLLDRFKPHLKFTNEEEIFGKESLKKFGLTIGSKFVCLNPW